MLSVGSALLRWTGRRIVATDADCLSKYSLNSVFVLSRCSGLWRQMVDSHTFSLGLSACFCGAFKSVCRAPGRARAPAGQLCCSLSTVPAGCWWTLARLPSWPLSSRRWQTSSVSTFPPVRLELTCFLCFLQRGLFRGGDGSGEGHRQDGGDQVHPQEGPEGEGDQHRERDRCAAQVGGGKRTRSLGVAALLHHQGTLAEHHHCGCLLKCPPSAILAFLMNKHARTHVRAGAATPTASVGM